MRQRPRLGHNSLEMGQESMDIGMCVCMDIPPGR